VKQWERPALNPFAYFILRNDHDGMIPPRQLCRGETDEDEPLRGQVAAAGGAGSDDEFGDFHVAGDEGQFEGADDAGIEIAAGALLDDFLGFER